MLKRIRKRINKRMYVMAMCAAAALCQPSTSFADNGQNFSASPSGTYTINTDISTSSSYGVWVKNSTTPAITVNTSNHSITTTGDGHAGLYSETYGTITYNLDNVAITTSGNSVRGSLILSDGVNMGFSVGTNHLVMNGGSITTSGSQSNGLTLYYSGNSANLTNVAIQTQGANAHAVFSSSGATITMNGGSITALGAGSCGAYTNYQGTISLTNVGIQAAGTALYADGIYLSGGITASVNGQNITAPVLMHVQDNRTINLTASGGSQLYGKTEFGAGHGTANLTLNNNAAWTLPDSSALTNLALDDGMVTFASPTSGYKTLNVNGNLSGNGGTFNMNANLSAALADCINVSGNSSGSHTINITNQGGRYIGPQVVKVVNLNEANTNTATFTGGDIGPYRYHLTTGSQVPGGYTGVDSLTDYYLYGNLTADQSLSPSNSANAAIGTSAATNVLWYSEMNEIRKRMGELRIGTQSSDDFWVRAYADSFKVRPIARQSFDLIARGIELGRDNPQSFQGGIKHTGFLVGSGKADNTFAESGTGNIESLYVGSYGSWIRDDGTYFDLIGKYNWFRHFFSAPVLGGGSDNGKYRGRGLGLSSEIGKRIERGGGVFIEPAAELSALWATHDSYFTANQINVEVPSTRSLQLRLGCTVGKKTVDSDGTSRQLYGKFSWVNEYAGESSIKADAATFDSSIKGHQWVGGIGFVEDRGKHQFYIDVEKSWGNTTSKPWGINSGMRWKF